MSDSPFLYPNVTSLPGQSGVSQTDRMQQKPKPGEKGEFEKVFDQTIDRLNEVKPSLKLSAHAAQRLKDRNIKMDQAMMAKVSDAVDKADAKGLNDALVLTGDSALIVSVKNRTIITALDRNQMAGNVFTNIDGAVII